MIGRALCLIGLHKWHAANPGDITEVCVRTYCRGRVSR